MLCRCPWTVIVVATAVLCGVTIVTGQGEYDDVPDGAASLAFVFDITGSMYDDLVQVIEGARKILATTVSRTEKPLYNYVLVPFHDPDVGPVVVTRNPDDFRHELRNLYVQGGEDCPEMSITAIKQALEHSLPNSFIYVFTDARSKDFYLTDDVLALVQKKQSQVVFVLTGDCDDSEHEGYKAYEKIASTSSGQVFLLKKSQVNEVLNFVRVAVQARKVNLISVDVESNYTEFDVPVDSKLQEITVSVSGVSPKIALFDPAGNPVTKRNGLQTLLNINKALIVNVKDPQPGTWKLKVRSPKPHTIRMTGLSTTDFTHGFSRKPVDHLSDTKHRPISGISNYLMINATDMGYPAIFNMVEMLDIDGTKLGELVLEQDDADPSIYRTSSSFVPPDGFFYLRVSGADDKGYNIHRLTPTAMTPIIPDKPSLWMPEVTKGYFGLTAVLTCSVDSLTPYTVRWFREEAVLGPEQYFIDPGNVTLDLQKANQFSEGIYFCEATNNAGSRRIPTFLDISEPPPAITVPLNVSVLPGADAVLTCNVFSTVPYNVTWHAKGYRDHLRSSQKFFDYGNGTLVIRNVGLSDEGAYTCRASNEGGRSEQNAFVRVQVPPIPSVKPSAANFATGESLELVCKSKGYPDPSIYWVRDGQPMVVSEHVRINGGTLTLRNLQKKDAGVYMCVAENQAGEASVNANLYYIEAPVITEHDGRVLVASGDEAILVCRADGIPPPQFHWYKGDVELKALSYVQISDSGQLHLLGAHSLDAGDYRCEAVNEAGSDSAVVTLEVGSEPEIIEAPQNTGVDIGLNTTMHCRARGLPIPTLFWQRLDGRPLDHSGRVQKLESGALFIQDASLEDEGSYVCVAQNQFGTTESSAYLSITGIEPPMIGYMDPVVQARQGDDVELNCEVLLGNPPPSVQWLHRGHFIQADDHIQKNGGGNIVIQDIQASHAGDYLCSAVNVGGNATFIVSVEVAVPPSFDLTGVDAERVEFDIIEGDGIVLPCDVTGDPRPYITWYKDESPISFADYHYFIREDGSLEIYSAEAADTGRYRCQATNEAGEIEKTINLNVQVPPIIAGEPSEEYIVIENKTVVLPCSVNGEPAPEISWRKNFVPFEPEQESGKYLFGPHGLTIEGVKIEDKAIYECIANNVAGEETKILTLVVQIPPVVTSSGPNNLVIMKGEDVELGCENIGDPVPQVEWSKDEALLSVYTEEDGYQMLDSGSLHIESAEVSHTGRYVCVVTNDAGIATKDYYLSVHDPPSLPKNLSSYQEIIETNPIVLRCPATGTPTPLITWYKDDVLIGGDLLGVAILEDGSLQLQDTAAEDSALYTCRAQSVAGSTEHQVELKVLVPPKLTGKDVGKQGLVDQDNVVVTHNTTLTCPVESDPPPTITWLKDGFELELEKEGSGDRITVSSDGRVLSINAAVVDDTARYTCIAKNVAGETEKSFDLDVHVPPEIDEESVSPSNNTIVKDNKLYLDCPVKGIPRPNVVWYKDGEVISPDLDANFRVFADGRRLEIIGARVIDTGRFTCVGENVAGTTEHNFDVDVQVPPKVDHPNEISKPENIEATSVEIQCPASGTPRPVITWYKNNQPVTANTSRVFILNNGWTLKITDTKVDDTARYTCRAKNPAGETEKAFDLNILVKPRIDRINIVTNPKVLINQTTVINCPVEGKPSPDITWYKNGIVLDPSSQTRFEILSGGRQLRVRNAQVIDTAEYQCLAINKAGSDSVDYDLEVQVPSRIELHNRNTNPKVVEGGSLTITCPATGIPPPQITWYMDGDEIKVSEIDNIKTRLAGRELLISDAKVQDTGRYTCVAANAGGVTEIYYDVDVQVPPTIDDTDLETDVHATLDNAFTFYCPAKGIPEPDVVWFKDGVAIDYDLDFPHYNLADNGKELTILHAMVNDKGSYVCVAANEAGSAELEYIMDVWVPPYIDSHGLDLNPKIIKGHTSVLFCPTEGNPTPDILWLKAGQPVQLDSRLLLKAGGMQLEIHNSTESDTAIYTCTARNPAGHASLDFNLQIQVPPSIDESNVVYFRKVIQGQSIVIECPVSGIPPPEVSWLVNGQVAQPSGTLTFSHNNYYLEIPQAEVSDSAVYTCIASNEAGDLRKKFDLEVQVPPKIDIDNADLVLTVIQNRSRSIVCLANGIPTPSILWLKDGVPLLDWPYPDLSLSGDELRLEVANAQTDDAGVYTCSASNPAGEAEVDFKLNVHVPPEISGSQFVSELAVVKGNPITMECVASGVPQPLLTWSKGKDIIEDLKNPHIRFLKEGQVLQITSANVTDTGRYICHAENRAGIAERLFDLQVQVPPKIQLKGHQEKWVVINNPLTLECPAEGIPEPQTTWMRQGQIIPQYGNPSLRIVDNGKKLLIVSAQLLDFGDYTCHVSNEAGIDVRNFTVSVYVPPTIDDGPSLVQAVINTGATLQCESLGLPDPIITWEKDGNPFPTTGLRHRMRVSGTIDFTSVGLEDAGKYKCMASNEAGNVTREVQLDVQEPPRMMGRQPLYIKTVKGEGILLPCDVTGTPPPRILWQKGTKVIRGQPGVHIQENGSLYLQQTDRQNAGVYICIAQNAAGTAFGQIRLQIQETPEINVRETDFTVNNAQNIVLPCTAFGRPRPKISWLKDGTLISSSNAYLRILRNGLAIPFARPEDAGTYTCIATNNAGSKQVDLTLTVQVSPQIGEASRLLTFKVTETAIIECAAIGIPPPTISWLKDGRPIVADGRKFKVAEYGTLIISNLTEDDTGSYTCTATNVAGEATQERLIRVQVPPTFIVVPKVQEVVMNSRAELRCTADGIPTPTIHWKLNGFPLPSQPSVNGRSVYIIQNVRREDGGEYTCLAQNPAGEASVTTMLVVKVPPEILTPPGNKAVKIAEKVVLACSVGGDPPPEVIWMKNDRPVQLSSRIQKLPNNSLVIYDSTSTDAGEYTCVATNDAGTSTGVAMLTVREPPSFQLEPMDTRVEQGKTARIDCLGSGEPAPKMDWMIGWDVLEDKGRLSILPNNSLMIVAAQLSDSGVYRCLASNNLGQTFIEVSLTVTVHGEWSVWSAWQDCSTTCGEGRQLRHRACDSPEPANDGRDCDGQPEDSRPCQLIECAVNGEWGNWLPWESCSVSCGDGERMRKRLCDNPQPQFNGSDCLGSDVELEPCKMATCAVDGSWGEWSDWQQCSATCGDGVQERTRLCDNPSPSNGGKPCWGSDIDRKTCELQECPVDGVWGNWGHWAPCSVSCGGGTRNRARLCNNPAPQYGGLFCVGLDVQQDFCNNEACPVHGGWSEWGDYGQCTVSCGGGLQRRFRTCSSPTPTNNGRPCAGPSEDTISCNQASCPVDGSWSAWSEWSACSKTCDRGTKQRERSCTRPRHGGLACRGDSVQVTDCHLPACFTIPVVAEGNLVGYINNIDIPAGTFTADMIPLPDSSATHVDATLRGIPALLAPHFRHLMSVLSPVYWTTAMEVDGAYNGFSLTDGVFTREVQVQYTTGESLKMSHYSKGVDHDGKLQLDIVVRGHVPDIADTQIIKVTPYWERYTQTGAGLLHADSSRLFSVDGFPLPYAWNHSIIYDNNVNKMPYLVQRLYARNMEVQINPDQEIVHFKLDTSIAPGSPSNQCPPGYNLNQEGPYCHDQDECEAMKPCSDYCHNSPGSFACSCPIGLVLDIDGRNCVDIDECSTGSNPCEGDQQCVNTIGSFRCQVVCRRGLRPSADGQKCEDVNECEESPGVCSQICVNRLGGYKCRCTPGYRRLSRGRCRDINECKLQLSPCEQLCSNTPGSYTCGCRNGFELISAGRCRDINECRQGENPCGQGQDCINSVGSYRCITLCPRGFREVDGKCKDIDECATNQHRCYYNQRCVNTAPGYRCLCPPGYRSSGPGTPCLDIDECAEQSSVCAYKCENFHGGYECVCAPGQVRLADRKSCAGLEFLDKPKVIDTNSLKINAQIGHYQGYRRNTRSATSCPPGFVYSKQEEQCIDFNECLNDPGICQHNCTNTIGSYQCTCPPGYRVASNGNCDDINECAELDVNCGLDKMCFNQRGDFTCIKVPCPTGYQRDPITNFCVLECIDAEIACPKSQKYADVIQFRTLALPSGVVSYQDLIRLKAYNQNDELLRRTTFTLLKNDPKVAFHIRLENGMGIVFTSQPLEDQQAYRITVQAKSYDNGRQNIQYQTTFIIHISVSAYPY